MEDIYPGLSQKHVFLIIEGFLPRNFGVTFGLLLKQRKKLQLNMKINLMSTTMHIVSWHGRGII